MFSIIISARNDPIGCLVTTRAVLNEAKSIPEEVEVIIVDNSSHSDYWRVLNLLIDDRYKNSKIRLCKQNFECLFTARDLGVLRARYKYVIILDSHMMLGKDSLVYLRNFLIRYKEAGIIYGPLVYHNKTTESGAYHSRDLTTFRAIKLGELKSSEQKIPFRGVPFVLSRDYYFEIGGYGALSYHKLSWGGGDAYIGIKGLLFGRDNYLLKEFVGLHIGPFKNDPYLCDTTEFERINGMRWMGVLVAGYAIGGKKLLDRRINRIRRRLEKFENFNEKVITEVMRLGEQDRRWIRDNAKYHFDEMEKKWAGLYSV